MINSEHNLVNHYQLFSRDHDRLKAELMARLPEVNFHVSPRKIPWTGRIHLNYAMRRGLAAAVIFGLLLTVAFLNLAGPDGSGTNQVWADPMQVIKNINSIHFTFLTPGQNASHNASVEVWWQSDGCYRMEYSNGLIYTYDGNLTYIKSPNSKLRVLDYDGPGPHSFILSVLGEIGGQDRRYNAMPGMTEQANQVSSHEILFEGQQCLEVSSDTGHYRYQYIIDRSLPVIYSVAMYRSDMTENPIALAKVLDIDGHLDSSLFVIQADVVQNH